MNKKGFIDLEEVNVAYVALALAAAVISLIVMSIANKNGELGVSFFIKVLTPIATFVATYFYLALTDR